MAATAATTATATIVASTSTQHALSHSVGLCWGCHRPLLEIRVLAAAATVAAAAAAAAAVAVAAAGATFA